jgi:AraC-like DNA-binding protein
MAKGAYLAARSINMEKNISFIGIDALDGPDGGSTFVQNGVLMASFIYPSGGGKAIQVAMDILSGKQVQKINLLPTSVVDSTNIQLMALHNTYVSAQRHMVNNLGDKVGEMTEQYTQQQSALHLTIVSLIGAILILAIFIVLYKQRNLINRRLKTQNDTISKHNEMLERKLDEFIAAIKDDQKERLDSSFLAEFDQIISEQMSDPALSVDSISRTMGLSRAGLYRKLKESAGSTPNDYIRSRRLELARRMLLTSDLSISEICYRTGFNTPSYFAKCFKDEFGSLPSEYLEMNKQQRDR